MEHYVEIKLFANLINYISNNKIKKKIKPNITIKCLIEEIGIPLKKVKLIFINGVIKNKNSKIKNGDTISLFPPVGGG